MAEENEEKALALDPTDDKDETDNELAATEAFECDASALDETAGADEVLDTLMPCDDSSDPAAPFASPLLPQPSNNTLKPMAIIYETN